MARPLCLAHSLPSAYLTTYWMLDGTSPNPHTPLPTVVVSTHTSPVSPQSPQSDRRRYLFGTPTSAASSVSDDHHISEQLATSNTGLTTLRNSKGKTVRSRATSDLHPEHNSSQPSSTPLEVVAKVETVGTVGTVETVDKCPPPKQLAGLSRVKDRLSRPPPAVPARDDRRMSFSLSAAFARRQSRVRPFGTPRRDSHGSSRKASPRPSVIAPPPPCPSPENIFASSPVFNVHKDAPPRPGSPLKRLVQHTKEVIQRPKLPMATIPQTEAATNLPKSIRARVNSLLKKTSRNSVDSSRQGRRTPESDGSMSVPDDGSLHVERSRTDRPQMPLSPMTSLKKKVSSARRKLSKSSAMQSSRAPSSVRTAFIEPPPRPMTAPLYTSSFDFLATEAQLVTPPLTLPVFDRKTSVAGSSNLFRGDRTLFDRLNMIQSKPPVKPSANLEPTPPQSPQTRSYRKPQTPAYLKGVPEIDTVAPFIKQDEESEQRALARNVALAPAFSKLKHVALEVSADNSGSQESTNETSLRAETRKRRLWLNRSESSNGLANVNEETVSEPTRKRPPVSAPREYGEKANDSNELVGSERANQGRSRKSIVSWLGSTHDAGRPAQEASMQALAELNKPAEVLQEEQKRVTRDSGVIGLNEQTNRSSSSDDSFTYAAVIRDIAGLTKRPKGPAPNAHGKEAELVQSFPAPLQPESRPRPASPLREKASDAAMTKQTETVMLSTYSRVA